MSYPGLDFLKMSEHLSQLDFLASSIGSGILADAPTYPIRRVQSPF